MSIPDFNSYGILPEGIYKATLDEIEEKFCNIGNIVVRKKLFSQFLKYLEEIKKHDVAYDIYIDGSFVIDKNTPGDIDILLFYNIEYDNKDWSYLLHEQVVKKKYTGLHVLTGSLDMDSEKFTIDFAMSHFDDNTNKEMKKGIIKVII